MDENFHKFEKMFIKQTGNLVSIEEERLKHNKNLKNAKEEMELKKA
jgi:hypothetical protein